MLHGDSLFKAGLRCPAEPSGQLRSFTVGKPALAKYFLNSISPLVPLFLSYREPDAFTAKQNIDPQYFERHAMLGLCIVDGILPKQAPDLSYKNAKRVLGF